MCCWRRLPALTSARNAAAAAVTTHWFPVVVVADAAAAAAFVVVVVASKCCFLHSAAAAAAAVALPLRFRLPAAPFGTTRNPRAGDRSCCGTGRTRMWRPDFDLAAFVGFGGLVDFDFAAVPVAVADLLAGAEPDRTCSRSCTVAGCCR